MGAISAMLLIASMIAAFLCVRKAVPLLAHLRRTLPLAHVDRRLVLEGAKSRIASTKLLAPILRKAREKKRAEELQKGMPELLRLLCIALDSGSSLVMALRYAADNCDEPSPANSSARSGISNLARASTRRSRSCVAEQAVRSSRTWPSPWRFSINPAAASRPYSKTSQRCSSKPQNSRKICAPRPHRGVSRAASSPSCPLRCSAFSRSSRLDI